MQSMLQLPPHGTPTPTLTLAYNPHIKIATVLQTNTTPTCNHNKIVLFLTSVALCEISYKQPSSPCLIGFRFGWWRNKGPPKVPPTCHIYYSPES
jgi:hypothetical protein